MSSPADSELKKRKPRNVPKPYPRTKPKKTENAPKTSAQTRTSGHQNLTQNNWLGVISWHDEHTRKQINTVQHFAGLPNPLLFDQASLSHHLTLEWQEKHLKIANSIPNGLSSKRELIVMRPDVDKALYLWVRHMEDE
ncbi:uncharacterized protein BXZ73DRAFT_100327 [Epithele typhae]|uniref:uncharacterized protein n=1 Tax=Epithele typhae TaxID=378194 RepID=UPI002007E1F7|nr:uncharacterized protein BXZ73DRAFT_100327 [Epithele typhae]KAH9935853.1 hypothetical protein BXZ73DRAFT_100327 [Epithele typhae]